jgi:hypothetical protein
VIKNKKKSIGNGTKVKRLKAMPEERMSLLYELAHPQKKPFLSDFITPLDPVSDEEMCNVVDVSSVPAVAEQDNGSQKCSQVNIDTNMIRSECDVIEEFEPHTESEGGNKKSGADKEERKETDDRKSSEVKSKIIKNDSQILCDGECVVNESPSSSKEKRILTGTSVLLEVLPSVPYLMSTHSQKQVTDDLSVTVREAVAAASKDGTPSAETNHSFKKTEENIMIETLTCEMKKGYVADPTTIDNSCKNLDLKQNRENMKQFVINMPNETHLSGSDVKLAHSNDKIDETLSSLQKFEVSSSEPSVPISHGYPTCKPHTYVSCQKLVATKFSEQNKEPSFASTNAISEDSQPPSVNGRLTSTLSEASVSRPLTCYPIVQIPVPANVIQQLGRNQHAVVPSSSQAINLSVSTGRTKHHPLNIPGSRSSSLNLHSGHTGLTVCLCKKCANCNVTS